MTYNEFEKKYLGKAVDYDGTAGVQCVDLADQYLKDVFGITGVWVQGARDFYNNFASYPALVKNFDRIPNSRDLVCQKGDIVIWGGGTWGHVAIADGSGTKDWFSSIEQNTLGKHEPTQRVEHHFAYSYGVDGCNPVLGVLRAKDQSKVLGDLPVLDKGSCYKKGDKTVGSLAVKSMLKLAKIIKLHNFTVSDSKEYDDSAVKAVSALQRRWGYKETGCAGENFVRRLYEALK